MALEAASARAAASAASGPTDLSRILGLLKGLTDDMLENRIREILGRIAKPLIKADVEKELRDENARSQDEAAPPVSDDPAPPPAPTFVVNRASGVVHKAVGPRSGSMVRWATVCGWRFASSANADLLTTLEESKQVDFCEKCLPSLREDSLTNFPATVRRQCGELD